MNNREDFEKWIDELLEKKFIYPKPNEEHVYMGWQEATARAQKIIDELKAENFAMSAMLCKHPDKRTIDENYDSTKDYCDILKAENPDVPCPVCGGKVIIDRDYSCTFCDFVTGTVPLTKAQEYRIRELENGIKELIERLEMFEYDVNRQSCLIPKMKELLK